MQIELLGVAASVPRSRVFAVGCVGDLYECVLLQTFTIRCRVRIFPFAYVQLEMMLLVACKQRQRHALTECCACAQGSVAQ